MPNAKGQPVITVDGTSASGKSTLAKKLAFIYGATLLPYNLFFRLIAEHMLQSGYEIGQKPTPEQIEEAIRFAKCLKWEAHFADEISVKEAAMHEDRFKALNLEEVSRTAPYFSGIESILHITDATIRGLIDASSKPVVIEGRTVGKYVYPDADVKLYVDADFNARAIRRTRGLIKDYGRYFDPMDIKIHLQLRDEMDQTRDYQPAGLYDVHSRIDTTKNSATETLAEAIKIIQEKCPELQMGHGRSRK